MIVFDLLCSAGHRFEGWFNSADDFASQKKRKLRAVEIECPDPGALASRWGEILERPVKSGTIALDAGEIRFLPGSAPEPAFAGVELEAAAPAAVELCGVRFRSVDA